MNLFLFSLFFIIFYYFLVSKNEKKHNNSHNLNFLDSHDDDGDSDCSDYSVNLDEISPESVIFSHTNLPQMSKSVNRSTKGKKHGFYSENYHNERDTKISENRKTEKEGKRVNENHKREREDDGEVEKEGDYNDQQQFRYVNLILTYFSNTISHPF